MFSTPLSELVVEVLHDSGSESTMRWWVGSGFVISPGRVLTAATVAGPGELLVRLSGNREFSARVLIRGDEDTLDLAVLEVPDLTNPVAPPLYGTVDRDHTWGVKDCWAIGFPSFKERHGRDRTLRNSVQAMGQILPAENLGGDLLTFQLSSGPLPQEQSYSGSPWAGMAGAAVFAGDILIGIVTQHHPPEGVNVLTVLPITALNSRPDAQTWWTFLGGDPQQLVNLSPSSDRHERELAPDKPALKTDKKLIFVIASFLPDMDPAFEAIKAAAAAVGLRAQRVKDVSGDYKISDKMLMMIRQARLIVADLTHERPNVYFELGYARGLGKTVITIMREGSKVHFDVQDWTYLPYIDSRPLERDLIERFNNELSQ